MVKEPKTVKVVRLRGAERTQSGPKKLATEKPAEESAGEAQPQPVLDLASTLYPVPAPAPTSVPVSAPKAKQQSIVINVFPEADSIPEPGPTKKSSRFSKSGTKIPKKSLWARSKAQPITV